MVQTGSPASDGKSKSSISIHPTANRLFEDEIKPALGHSARGTVSMANKGPDTNGSQFFILFAPAPHLDGKNTIFARVIDGFDALDALEAMDVDTKGRMKEKVRINSVIVHANPLADGLV